MRRRALPVLGFLVALVACERSASTSPWGFDDAVLQRDGVLVAYNLGCARGCEGIARGDVLWSIDDRRVRTSADVDAARLTDGAPHRLELWPHAGGDLTAIEVVAKPRSDLPPLEDVPPFWTVGAAELDRAPAWARRRMFGHASPMVQLVAIDGGILDGRQLVGKKRLMVYWDWGDRVEEANAVAFMQVLQKAQADLAAKGVEIMFTHLAFPTARKQPMNDSDLRAFAKRWAVKGSDGAVLPAVPIYRRPNETEYNAARELGLENAYTVMENLGQSPAIVVLDARGIVRWHSEGLATPPVDAQVQAPEQYTIIEAVTFALDSL
jgi:hypothetical protein